MKVDGERGPRGVRGDGLASFPGSHTQLQCLSSGAWEPGNEARATRITSTLRTEDWDAGNKARLTLLSKKERQSSGNHPQLTVPCNFQVRPFVPGNGWSRFVCP